MKNKKIYSIIILCLCVTFVLCVKKWIGTSPFKEVAFENVVYATKDSNQEILMLDASGTRLVKMSGQYELQWFVEASSKHFYEAKRVVSGIDGNIYVQDITKEDASYQICEERILKYSPEGKKLGVVASYTYEDSILVSKIAGIYQLNGKMVYIYKQEDGFDIFDMNENRLASFDLKGTSVNVSSFAIDSKNNQIYYVTYQGLVYKYVDGIHDIVLYDAANEELSIPKEASYDAEKEILYISDIGMRDVITIHKNGTVDRILEDDLDLYEKEIAYYLNADYGLIVPTNYSIKLYEDGAYHYLISCKLTPMQKLLGIMIWVVSVVLVLDVLFIIYLILIMIIHSTRFVKLAAGTIGITIGLGLLFTSILLPKYQDRLLEAILSRAQLVSDMTVKQLPTDSLGRLNQTSDFMEEDYIRVREVVNDIFLSESENIHDLYCTLYTIQDDMITCSYCLQEDTGARYPYDWEFEGSDEQSIIQTKEGKIYSEQSSEGSYLFVLNPIVTANGEVVGLIEVGTDLNSFQEENYKIVFDLLIHMVAIAVVVILMAIEFILFLQGKSIYEKNLLDPSKKESKFIPNEILRMIVFAIFFLTNIVTGFLPIYAMNLSDSKALELFPVEVLAALPISVEVVVGAVFSVFGNTLIAKFGQKRVSILSTILFSFGFVIRIIPNIWLLTLGNALIGAGWGNLLLIINTIIATKKNEDKDKGFAYYSAAALSGVNCGAVFGGFMTNWFSYQWIFVSSAVLSLSLIYLTRKYLAKNDIHVSDGRSKKKEERISFWKFIMKKKIFIFFFMIVIPIIACGYFINYLFPILGSLYGLDDTTIGYSYLLNGLCVICFSSVLTNLFTKKIKKKYALVIATIIYTIAFYFVAKYQNIQVLLLALILLGLSDSFGLPLQTSYYTDLEEVKQYGYDRAIGIYSLFENVAQAAGSFIFSYVLIIGVEEGLMLVATIIIILALIFMISSMLLRRHKKTAKNKG